MNNPNRVSELPNEARAFTEYFCCPPEYSPFRTREEPVSPAGFFRFGPAICYGRVTNGRTGRSPFEDLFDARSTVAIRDGRVLLDFNPTEAVENLRQERYLASTSRELFLHNVYYTLRPILPSGVRRRLQQVVFRGRRSHFPRWPVDCTVEEVFAALMQLALSSGYEREVPFIWFWPEGRPAAVMMTHDVEQAAGAQHCQMLMDLDESYGLKAAFQLIPERRYSGVEELVTRIRERGFEVNLHDLDHDGRLYEHLEGFQQRARRINEHGRRYHMRGFRAGAMHRNQAWFGLLEFEYEMSVPNVSHLEPQRGGCCTVMPYFVGNLLELPLTTIQDYAMFYILRQSTVDLWKQQIGIIASHYGLISFILHPDYLVGARERGLCSQLMEHIASLREERRLWVAAPGDINTWFRQRSRMQLARQGNGWQIRGEGSERARVAYARLVDGKLQYRLASQSVPSERHEPALET